ncbi:uncharacterized protein LY89DRAFT_741779 [Mollisia scopiformis]|uniref:Uncharacterized protein n=1 Tax=Mollisia scopiformis TaxID=149040 RepID=A0A132B8T9_MOLSC|nr:uncharacterized protein LY89DRAFT_741779 [Mollisia scopiformis]KUJ08409.1 hypothetical protein LY89DRAFT_741779 [Mollisia scopiformis]
MADKKYSPSGDTPSNNTSYYPDTSHDLSQTYAPTPAISQPPSSTFRAQPEAGAFMSLNRNQPFSTISDPRVYQGNVTSSRPPQSPRSLHQNIPRPSNQLSTNEGRSGMMSQTSEPYAASLSHPTQVASDTSMSTTPNRSLPATLQRPTAPRPRELLEHEIRHIILFYQQVYPSAGVPSTLVAKRWWYAKKDDLTFYKQFNDFRKENETPEEKSKRVQANKEDSDADDQYRLDTRVYQSKMQKAGRVDPVKKAAKQAQLEQWGETEEERREGWRLAKLQGGAPEQVRRIQPSSRKRKRGDDGNSNDEEA